MVKADMPNEKMPVLEFEDGTKVDQSLAISRFVARKTGHYPEYVFNALKCDSIVDHVAETLTSFVAPVFQKDAAKEEAVKELFDVAIPDFMKKIDPYLNDDGWLSPDSDKLSMADFWVGGLYVNFFTNKKTTYGQGLWEKALEDYPKFSAYGKRFAEAKKEHLDKRGAAPF